MRIAIASDHRGYEAKRRLLPALRQWGHEVRDFGCDDVVTTDYPDYAIPVAMAVADGRYEAGILLDGMGIGMSVAANKVCGVRAATAHDEMTSRLSREHMHCNVLCIGADLTSEKEIRRIVQAFLGTAYGNGRHLRRVEKLRQFEQQALRIPAAGKMPLGFGAVADEPSRFISPGF